MLAQPLILASASPRRQELLQSIGQSCEQCAVDVDEHEQGEPEQVVRTLAKRKAQAAERLHPDRLILAADTLVHAQGQTLGKPLDDADAARMLRLLSGSVHQVYSGVCLLKDGIAHCLTECTSVYFEPLDEAEILRYIASGEPRGKAGAYAIQGLAGQYVSRIEGSYSNVVGLPLHAVTRLLKEAGIKS